jgi:hypothetical protein
MIVKLCFLHNFKEAQKNQRVVGPICRKIPKNCHGDLAQGCKFTSPKLHLGEGENFSPHLTSPKIFEKPLSPIFTLWVSLGEKSSPHLTSPKIFRKSTFT